MAGTALTAGSQRLRILLAIPALVGVFALGEMILDRRVVRFDLTPDARHTLSDHALRVLDGLTADVRVLAFLRSPDPRSLVIEDLLRQAQARTPHLTLQILDVNRSPALAREYGIDSYGAVVVESGGRRRVFSNPREDVLVAALLQVTRRERKVIGWVFGHGEGDLASTDRKRGFSTVRTLLEQEYYEIEPISLLGGDVPPDVTVLVIAGPHKDLLPEEIAALDHYLQRAGHVLALLAPRHAPALAGYLARYRLDLPPDVVIEPSRRLYGGEALTMQVTFTPGEHPILGPLSAPALFSLTRSIGVLPGDDAVTEVVPFLRTSDESWATPDPAALEGRSLAFVADRDRRGPLVVGVEAAFRAEALPGAAPRQGRLIVYGNAEFADNFFIEFLGNKDLFVNTVDWLAYEHAVIGHRPYGQELGVGQFFVSDEDGRWMFWTTAVLEPGLFLAVGLVLAAWRRG
ncbi:MAG: Gldg family protein [Candidatus Binatia bacterium]